MGSAVITRVPPAEAARPRLSTATIILASFIVIQALDGLLSYLGVSAHGLWLEGNPIVSWYAHQFGPGVAFAGAKLFAITCGGVLYLAGRHAWLAVLTVVHLVAAVVPWTYILAQG
jgi:hypothetical protein